MRHLIWVFSFFTFSVAADINRYEYYGKLPFWETPIQNFMGQNPLSEEESRKLSHVRVGYDHLNRIVDIQVRQGSSFKLFSRGLESLYLHAVHTKIRYQDNLEIHTFFDQFGNQMSAWGEVWEKRYETDERNRYVKLYFVDKNNNRVENRHGYADFQWKYQNDGSVIETRYNLEGELKPHRPGFEFLRIRLYFDSNGHLSLMQNIDENGVLVKSKSGAAQYRYFYNTEGGFERWEVLDEKGEPALGPTGTAGEQYTFGDIDWIKIAFFNQRYQPDYHDSGAVNWHAEYDKFGNMIKRWFTDENEKPINGKMGFHLVRYVYDDKGLYHIRTELYGADGKPTINVDGVSQIHYKRNELGLIIEQSNLDLSVNLVLDAWYKFAFKKFDYDANNRLVKTTEFDVDGTMLKEIVH